jgi:hypothetical protein
MQVCHALHSPYALYLTLHIFKGHEDTYQSYSSFTTSYKPATEYESLLLSASKLRSRAVKAYERREPSELALVSVKQLSSI